MVEVVQMHFTTEDYVIFALLLVASAGIGLFYAFSGGRQRTTQVYQPGHTFISIHLLFTITISLTGMMQWNIVPVQQLHIK